jgi:predicted nucleic acid-binding protein
VILYVDTSALVKLYVEEAGTLKVVTRVGHAEAVATALITYAEARAALARHHREGGITQADLRRAVRGLDREWRTYNVVDLSEALIHSAGALAERHALRGYDAVSSPPPWSFGFSGSGRVLRLRRPPQPCGASRTPHGERRLRGWNIATVCA